MVLPDLTLDLSFLGLVKHTDTHLELQSPDVHVFGLWEEARAAGEKPLQQSSAELSFPSSWLTFAVVFV